MLYLLDKDVKTVKWNGIPLHEASSAIVKEETNGDFTLTVRYPITDSGIYQLIKEDMLIKAPTPILGSQLFRIKKPVENDDSLDITAYHITDDIMQRSIKPVSISQLSCGVALSQMVQNAKTGLGDFSFTSDIMDSRTFNTTETETLYSVLLDGKHSIVGTWEGELIRDNFALSIKRNRGTDRGVVITTHKSLKSYQRTKNSQGVVTRIHASSTFKPDGAKDEVTIRVTVDSPLIGNYPYINEKDYENNNAKTVDELRKWAEAKFKNEGIDKISDAIEIEAYELDGQVIHLGDTVNIKSRKHNVDLYKKAIAYEYNALTEEYISITFDNKPGVGGSGVSSGVSNAAEAILGASAKAQEIAVDRAVKNANQAFDAEFDKRVEAINDDIEQAKASAEVYSDGIKQEIVGEMTKSNQQYQLDKQAQDKQIADVLAKASASVNLATEAKNISSRAKSDAIAEANRLVELSKTALTDQIKSVDVKVDDVANQIAAKVSKSDYDKLSGRIYAAETTIQAQAGQIAERLTRTEINSLVDSKGYQTASQVQQMVTRSADTLTQTISQVESKIPTNIGTRNYLLATDKQRQLAINKTSGYVVNDMYQLSDTLSNLGFTLNDTLYVAFDYTTTNKTTFGNFRVELYNSTTGYLARIGDVITTEKGKFAGKLTISNAAWLVTDRIKIRHDNTIATCTITKARLTKSTFADWSLAPEDLTTVTAFNEVKDTVRSHTQTIAEQGLSISQVLQTSQGLVNRVADLTASGNLVYDPTNYSKYREREPNSNLVLTGVSAFKLLRITQSGLTSRGWKGFQMPLHSQKFVAGEKLSYRVNLWVDALPDDIIGFEIKNGGTILANFTIMPTKAGSNQIFTGTFTVNNTSLVTDDYALHVWLRKNGTVAFGQLSIVRGDTPPQSFVDGTSAMQLAIESQVALLKDSWSFKTLNSAGDILSQANLSSSQFLLDAAKIRLKGKTLADEIQAIDGKFGTLFVADGTFGKLNANIIGAQAITGGQIKFDQAFFDKLMANEAYLKQLFAKNAFITQVQSVTMSAEKIIGGTLSSINGATKFDLQTGWINMDQQAIGIRNQFTGRPLQYLVYGSGTINGVEGSYTALLSNRNGLVKMDSTSVGIQFWNARSGTNVQTAVNLYGKRIDFTQSGQEGLGSIGFNTDSKTIDGINDIYIKGRSLAAILNNIFDNFRNLDHDGQYQRGYYSIW
ncbi:phage tail spike protein [Streptococcus sp. ZY19097]|uniref:phage tail spike protein n=1 Tax=Streptococcus sp. ZY19097 TaxID=3231906 RepID=UPI0034594BE8